MKKNETKICFVNFPTCFTDKQDPDCQSEEMNHFFTIKLLLFAVINCDLVCSYQHVISVDSSQGHDDSSCLQPNSGEPCKTLEYVESQLQYTANISVLIDICQPGVNLSSALDFTGYIDLSFQGENTVSDRVQILCNKPGSGLSFTNVSRLSLNHINISKCGVSKPYGSNITEFSALYFINCHHVNITDTVVFRSNGTGITMVDTYGMVNIISTEIIENSLHLERECHKKVCQGGRGLNILFYPYIATSTISIHHPQKGYSMLNATYTIDNCISVRNKVKTTENITELCGSTGVGGGALIVVGKRVNITIKNSVFQENYAETCGGGLLISFYNSNNHISLIQTNVSKNYAAKGSVGGGLLVFYSSHPNVNTLKLLSCNFENNTEGGVNIISSEIRAENDVQAIFFTDCSWTGNHATEYGAAVHIMAEIIVSGIRSPYPSVIFTNCTFSSNKMLPIKTARNNLVTQVNTVGTFYSNVLSVVFEGITVFADNTGTALYLSSCITSFGAGSNVTFSSNYGTNGGAIALISRSYLYLNGSSNFSFVNNTATHFGGAIYFHSVDTVFNEPCFIYNGICTNKSVFYFDGNRAFGGQGPHIFASSFVGCNISRCSPCYRTKPTELLTCLGYFTFANPSNTIIGTLPQDFFLNTSIITLFPGLVQQVNLTVLDSEQDSVPSVSYQATLARNSSVIGVDPHFQYVSNNTISIVGKPGESDVLQLNVLSTDVTLLINVSLLECPPGYIFDNATMTCNCMALSYYGLLKCDPQTYIRHGIWMGKCSEGSLCTADCPIGYCTYNTTEPKLYHKLPMNATDLEAAICASNRKGTICGKCKEGHSVYYNSWTFDCVEDRQCNLGPLYFVLSTIIPLTILFVTITLLDTNFANGWNGLLLFAQVVPALSLYGNGTIHYTQSQSQILDGIMYAFAILNLEFFNREEMAFCIWKGANFMDIQMVKLGSIAYALALVFVCVWIFNQRRVMRLFPCLLRRRYTVINGISAFFILCYSECLDTCFKVLTPTCLISVDNTCVKRVVFHSGDIDAFHSPHLKYAMVALCFLVFIVIIPPALLLLYPLLFKLLGLCRLSESRIAIFPWRIMPIQILDSFQNPFKDEYRFFAGLYLLYRALILAVNPITRNFLARYATVGLILGSITVLHAVFQPYKTRKHNIIDLLLFFNLAVLNGIAQYTYSILSASKERISYEREMTILFWTSLELVLLLIPIVCVLAYFAEKMWVQLKIWKKLKKGYRAIQNVA